MEYARLCGTLRVVGDALESNKRTGGSEAIPNIKMLVKVEPRDLADAESSLHPPAILNGRSSFTS